MWKIFYLILMILRDKEQKEEERKEKYKIGAVIRDLYEKEKNEICMKKEKQKRKERKKI